VLRTDPERKETYRPRRVDARQGLDQAMHFMGVESAAPIGGARRPAGPAWEDVRPHLDRLILRLPAAQRDAVALRYLQGLPLERAAEAMGRAPGDVRAGVDRALDSVRRGLRREGVEITRAALAAWLETAARAPAPPGLAAAIVAACANAATGLQGNHRRRRTKDFETFEITL
jgi:hypothetical protein